MEKYELKELAQDFNMSETTAIWYLNRAKIDYTQLSKEEVKEAYIDVGKAIKYLAEEFYVVITNDLEKAIMDNRDIFSSLKYRDIICTYEKLEKISCDLKMEEPADLNVLCVIQLIKQHPNLFKDRAILSIDNVFEKLKIIAQNANLSFKNLGNYLRYSPEVPDIDSPDLFIKEAQNYTNQLIKQEQETEALLKNAGIKNAFTLSLVIPDYITEEWLVEALKHDSFRRYGFVYNDLSNKTFAPNISEEVIRKVVFSTVTKFPKEHPFRVDENMKISSPDIKELNNNGIDGSGINVAVIDKPFLPLPKEIEHNLKEYNVEPERSSKTHFHGSVVSCILAGKEMGVAPNVNLFFYDEGNDITNDSIKALENIYQRNLNGANIKVVNISGSAHEYSPVWPELKNRLKEQGCYVIDSMEFGDKFTGINQYNDKYYFSDWQFDTIRSKICVPTGGKFILLPDTYDDYKYHGDVSYSWTIPRLSGMFALALQANPDLTYDEFVEVCEKTVNVNEEGIRLINPTGIINEVTLMNEEKRER